MKFKNTLLSPVRTIVLTVAAGWLTTACQENEFDEIANNAKTEITASEQVAGPTSLTVVGENTIFVSGVDCKTCTFVVAEGATEVDGAELGLSAGSIICLKSGINYGDITFVNLNGTTEKPIIIAQDTEFSAL